MKLTPSPVKHNPLCDSSISQHLSTCAVTSGQFDQNKPGLNIHPYQVQTNLSSGESGTAAATSGDAKYELLHLVRHSWSGGQIPGQCQISAVYNVQWLVSGEGLVGS